MAGKKTTENNESGVNNSQGNENSEAEVKSKLQKQIDQLRSVISRIECSLGRSKFRDAKIITNNDNIDACDVNRVQNIDAKLQNELYRYTGFCCVKNTENENIYNFSSSSKYDKENTFAIQILINDGKGSLGKWVMPISIDLHELSLEYQIDNMKNVPHFLRTCKKYVDCYYLRVRQFQDLMKTVSQMKNCNLQSNLGYTQFMLELQGVHNVKEDFNMDLIVYLMYGIDEVWPYQIKAEPQERNELNKETLNCLMSCLKLFKLHDLNSAFEQIFTESSNMFVWSREDDDDSPFELNNLSSSEEGFLEELQLHSQSSKTSLKKKKTIQRAKKKRRHMSIANITNTSQRRVRSVPSGSAQKQWDSGSKNLLSKEKESITVTPNALVLKNTKPKPKLLRFQLEQDKETNKSNVTPSSEILSTGPMANKKIFQYFTSTPLCAAGQNTFTLTASTSCDISEINANEEIPRKITKHRNVEQSYENQVKEKEKKRSVKPSTVTKYYLKRNLNPVSNKIIKKI